MIPKMRTISKPDLDYDENPRTARLRRHKLLPREIARRAPGMDETESIPDREKIVVVKYFHPATNWRWFAVALEVDEGDVRFFGFVSGVVGEWGCFYLSELASIGDNDGLLPVERDLHCGEMTLGEHLARCGVKA